MADYIDFSQLTAPLVSALGSLADQKTAQGMQTNQFDFTREMTEKAYQQQNELMAKDFQNQKDLFDYQNAYNEQYNSPSAIIQRLKEAGLNPAFMFGQTATSNASIGSSGTPSASIGSAGVVSPSSNYTQAGARMSDSLKTLLDNARLQNEKKKTEQEIKESESRINLNDSIVGLNDKEGHLADAKVEEIQHNIKVLDMHALELEQTIDTLKQQITESNARIGNMSFMQKISREQTDIQKYDSITRRMEWKTRDALSRAEIQLKHAETANVNSDTKLKDTERKKLVNDIHLSYQQSLKNDIDLQYMGKQYQIQYEMDKGKLRILNIEGDIKDKTQYAEIGNAYIGMVDNAATTISHSMRAAMDVYTGGLSTIAPGSTGRSMSGSYSSPSYFQMGK